ncbi:2-C-methyl-D-erythritol 4-phosphate cytidylyltransferase [Salinicoccus halitifaciens]|uniref:2-C-methyl-D-erythritol 4-phosphate cytidylyltransferase n=1 Tax=Salinicoccus halitifaciens TaxID=1073415 RepID=A0ABV2E9Q5_9STAP|nr:2-C-methyl-D-erythritol 4-phosphate cytidylyltransferase [Salinicoccus halitifaciens]MCD2138284.1 2-C-methyl-D-erythritol 4-phosphate cytidylyltransferase [Salinicoccus halitifaciens]
MSYIAIIPAAGLGSRMGYGKNKVFIELDGKSIIERTVALFEEDPNCTGIYLAVREDETALMEEKLSAYPKVKGVFAGGRERQDSIYNVLKKIPESDHVFIHDGARPFASRKLLNEVYKAVITHKAVICGVKVKDTIKRVDGATVTETLEREELLITHTPQAFDYRLIMKAHENARREGLAVTDDSSMVEALGESVYIVESDYNNIKITTREDLVIAESIIAGRGESK